MEKVNAFLKRKNIVFSAKRYGIDALGAMAQGLFCSLLIGTILNNGCTVVDVIVEHPLYGQLTGPLQLSSRYDVAQFIARSHTAQPLSVLTGGIHLHTLLCPSEDAYRRVLDALRQAGFLLEG